MAGIIAENELSNEPHPPTLRKMQRKRFIGANWKMNPPPAGALEKNSAYHSLDSAEVVVFPTFIDLQNCLRSGELIVGAQCGRPEPSGPFTGDISIRMLKDAGVTHVLCGHSERRRHHEESDAMISEQVKCTIENGLTAILCIGESADEQELQTTEDVLKRQLAHVLQFGSGIVTPPNFIVAYEPVWAIGSGRTAAPQDAQAVHAYIRSLFVYKDIRIIYGGSVSGKNAKEFFAQPDIDGALVGGCSLKPEEFRAIVEAA